ncbi:MAG: C-GCAxxG-C-C family protein [Promethearchaeota archaeon]
MKNSKEAKKMARKARRVYFSTNLCSLTMIKPFQEAFDLVDDDVLKAVMGLEGGVFSKGSTCGVVTSGALTLAMLMDSKITEWKTEDEIKLHALIKNYFTWFHEKYGTTLCREKTGLDFWKSSDLAKLSRPNNLFKDLAHTVGSAKYLYSIKDLEPEIEINHDSDFSNKFHCAKQVLEKIRNETNIGNSTVERISVALDGGVGLQGGACGAMTGAVMAISLHLAKNIRKSSMLSNMKDLRESPKKLNEQKSFDDFYSVGGKFMSSFLEQTSNLECKDISNTIFNSWKEFQQFGASDSSKECQRLIEFAANKAINLINKKD